MPSPTRPTSPRFRNGSATPTSPPRASTTGARARRIARRFGSDTKRFWQMINKAAPRNENRVGMKHTISSKLEVQPMSAHPTADRIEQVAFGFMASKVLFSAIEFGLFSEL